MVYALISGFTLWMAIEAVRRGQAGSWLWIILMFPPIGGAIYFFTEVSPGFRLGGWGGSGPRRASGEDVRRAELEARRLGTAGAWSHLAAQLISRREFTKAVEAAQKAFERDAKSRDVRYELGVALHGAGRSAEAVPHLESVIAAESTFDMDAARFHLAQAREAAGDLPGARAVLEDLTQRTGRPEVLYRLGSLQMRLGDAAAARSTFQRLLDEAELAPPYLRRETRAWVARAKKDLKQIEAARS
jgi:hypothetical protein